MTKTKETVDRSKLEGQIIEAWQIINDLEGADTPELKAAILLVGNHRFEKLWKTFEHLVHNGDIK